MGIIQGARDIKATTNQQQRNMAIRLLDIRVERVWGGLDWKREWSEGG